MLKKRGATDTRGHLNSKNNLTMPWLKKEEDQQINSITIVHKTKHTKQKTEQHKPHQKLGVIKVVISKKCPF